MAAHTSGRHEYDPDCREIYDQNGNCLAELFDTAEGLEGGDAEADANGRLYAAAPEMYDFLVKQAAIGSSEAVSILEKIHAVQNA